jgi:O-antigen ligase
MPEKYRALIVILVLASAVFAFAKPMATAVAISKDDFIRRRNYWFYITVAAFVAPSFWIFAFVVGALIYKAAQQENNKIALYAFLFLALPQNSNDVTNLLGMGGSLFTINYLLICNLVILLPVCLHERRLAIKNKSPSFIADKIIIIYFIWTVLLLFPRDSIGGVFRYSSFFLVETLIPYYAISRSVRSIKDFRDVLMSFAIASMLAAAVAVFEFSRLWLLYSSLPDAWGVPSISIYLSRADLLRANATSGHAVVLGYLLATSAGLCVYLKWCIPSKKFWILGLLLLIAGAISSLAKGSWVGASLAMLIMMAMSPERILNAIKLLFALPVVVIGLVTTEAGNNIMGFLPFVGTVDEGSAAYRQLLFDISLPIILDNPIFGSTDYLSKMESLLQGQGIIDLVNVYVIVGLDYGLVGLGLFVAFFGVTMSGLFRAPVDSRAAPELLGLRNCFLGVMVGILLMISTISPLFHVVPVYIMVVALGNAFIATVSNKNGGGGNPPIHPS